MAPGAEHIYVLASGFQVSRAVRPFLAALCIAGLALAAAWRLRVARADYGVHQESVTGAEMAVRSTPDQAAGYARLAFLVEAEDPGRAAKALERAVALNPWDAAAWIQLGLRLEAEGNLNAAERSLLEAAAHDHQYLPRWTLANYYFRRGDSAHFWQWAKAAADMIYDDGTALFRLCGAVLEDGRLIQRMEIRRPEIQAHYLGYLLRSKRADLIMPAVRILLAGRRKADVALLLHASDRLLDENRVSDALELWNGLAEWRQAPFQPLDPHQGRVLTNAGFESPPTSHGFDWRVADPDGITVAQEEARGGLRLTFSGRQPDHCEILWQLVPLLEKSDFEVIVAYGASDIAERSGLTWRISDVAAGISPRLARLSLTYQRAPGTPRLEGYITLRGVELRPKVYLHPRRSS